MEPERRARTGLKRRSKDRLPKPPPFHLSEGQKLSNQWGPPQRDARPLPKPVDPWHYLTYHKPFCFDVKHVEALGWNPKYSNDDMLRESYDLFLTGGYQKQEAGSSFSPHRKRVKDGVLWFLKKVS